jgi:hypothetical protein
MGSALTAHPPLHRTHPDREASPVTALYDADDEAQDGPQTEPDSLRDLIVAQGMQETGIFVLLFTSDTAAAGTNGKAETLDASVELVQRTAAELAVDLDRLEMFSDDAYLLQAALGEAVSPEPTSRTGSEPA